MAKKKDWYDSQSFSFILLHNLIFIDTGNKFRRRACEGRDQNEQEESREVLHDGSVNRYLRYEK